MLSFTRDNTPIRFTENTIALTFKDSRHRNEIEKILLDGTYRPGSPDFALQTIATSPISKKKVSETSNCNWNVEPNNLKSIAVCEIEDDGGRVVLVLENGSDTLKTVKLNFLVLRLDGYSGFRLAQDPDLDHAIQVKLKTATPAVISAIKF
jgi:hypothetical protein